MRRLALAGKPNAGKSTFFRAATLAEVDVANYPFTTIEPNRGVAHVRTECPCLQLDSRCGNERCRAGKRYVPVELLDVAGLVPGASDGRGLGNQFLDALMDADAILNVLDAAGATNAEGEPVEVGTQDPVDEADFVESELVQWLADVIGRNWESVERQSRSPDFDLEATLTNVLSGFGASEAAVTGCLRALDYPADPIQWTDGDRRALASELRERTKPLLLVGNKADIAPPDNLDRLRALERPVQPATADGELALRRGVEAGVVEYDPGDASFEVVGDASESQLAGLEEIRSVMDDQGGTGVQAALNTAVFELLDHIVVYPVENETRWTDSQGRVLPDACLLPEGASPLDLAYAVHTDIGDSYVHAVDARSDRRIGEDQLLTDSDVIKIVSTAS
jgi:ribosome-binding ATPase YchF (GTP1/OBG family)